MSTEHTGTHRSTGNWQLFLAHTAHGSQPNRRAARPGKAAGDRAGGAPEPPDDSRRAPLRHSCCERRLAAPSRRTAAGSTAASVSGRGRSAPTRRGSSRRPPRRCPVNLGADHGDGGSRPRISMAMPPASAMHLPSCTCQPQPSTERPPQDIACSHRHKQTRRSHPQ